MQVKIKKSKKEFLQVILYCKYYLKVSSTGMKQDLTLDKSEDASSEKKEETLTIQENKTSPSSVQNLGFFTRILAPIFLTEREIENIQKK